MRPLRSWTLILVGLAFAAPAPGADKKSDDKKNNKDALVTAGELTGKLTHVEGAGKGFRVQIKVPRPNEAALREIANLKAQLAFTRDPNRARDLMNAIANQQRNLTTFADQDVEIQPADDLVVRVLTPPPAFDEKGNLRKYTRKELQELKGDDPKQPGYAADFDSLQPGQIVKITLLKKKGAPARPKPGKAVDAEFLAEHKPLASKILILQQPPPNNP
jgi:hypothetical protein